MNDLDFKKKYIKYKLKYLQLKQKKQSGGMIEPLEVISDLVDRIDQELQVDEKQIEQIEKGVLESPLPASSLKRIQISFSSSNYFQENFRELVRNIITQTQHSDLALNIARFISDVLHDMGDSSRQIRIDEGRLPLIVNGNSKLLFEKHLSDNSIIRNILTQGGYKMDHIFESINKYHGDTRIGVLDKPRSKFSIQNFMNLDMPKGFYLDVNIGEEMNLGREPENVIGIIDKGSEGAFVQPGPIWADGNMWFLDGLKPIPEDLSSFISSLPLKLEEILVSYEQLIKILESIAQEYFYSILNVMFNVNNYYNSVRVPDIFIGLEKDNRDNFFYWFLYFSISDFNFKVNITERGSSTYTYDLKSLEVEESNGNKFRLSDIGTHKLDGELGNLEIIDLCNLVCIIAKAFGDASYKLFISSISIFSESLRASQVQRVPFEASPGPQTADQVPPNEETEDQKVLCLIASQDRQFVRDLIKSYLSIKQDNLTMKIFFKTNLQARLTLLCNGSGHIGTEHFFNNVINNYRRSGYVSMTIKKMTEEEEGLFYREYTEADTNLFIRYEFLRIILLSSYGKLQMDAALELDRIRYQIPPRPILRIYLQQEINNNKDTIIKIIEELFEVYPIFNGYHEWVETLHGAQIQNKPVYYLDLFKKSLNIESTISMKTLLKDKKAKFTDKYAQEASKQTLEELCLTNFSLTDNDNRMLALTFLLMDGYIPDYVDAHNNIKGIIEEIKKKTSSSTVQFIEYFIYLLDDTRIETTEDMLKTFLINTFYIITSSRTQIVFQKLPSNREIWDEWIGRCEELIEDYPDDFCRFFANLLIIIYYSNPLVIKTRGVSNNSITQGLATISRKYLIDHNHDSVKEVTLNGSEISMCEIKSQSYLVNQHLDFLTKNVKYLRSSPELLEKDIKLLHELCYTYIETPPYTPGKSSIKQPAVPISPPVSDRAFPLPPDSPVIGDRFYEKYIYPGKQHPDFDHIHSPSSEFSASRTPPAAGTPAPEQAEVVPLRRTRSTGNPEYQELKKYPDGSGRWK